MLNYICLQGHVLKFFIYFVLLNDCFPFLLPVIPENASSQHYLIIVIFISGLFLLHC